MKRGKRGLVITEPIKRKIRLIEAKRKEGKITQEEAAASLGVCVPTYRKWRKKVAQEDLEKSKHTNSV